LIDPHSPAELRDALARLLQSPGLRAQLIAKGRLRARKFLWEDCAAASLKFFEALG
jgi:glycosyltransferase involved in cell wall biosynthesis